MSGTVFRMDLSRWLELTEAQIDAFARQVSQEAAFRVVESTPVDTGFLRGSWQPSIGEIATKSPEETQLDPAGAAAMAEATLVAAQVKSGDLFVMANGCAYADFVENGTAKMAGQHFVEKVVKSWPRIAARVLRDLNFGSR